MEAIFEAGYTEVRVYANPTNRKYKYSVGIAGRIFRGETAELAISEAARYAMKHLIVRPS